MNEIKIERLGYKVSKNGIVYEILPTGDNNEEIVRNFFENFKLVRSYKETPEALLIENAEIPPEKPIVNAKIPSRKQRRYAILNEMGDTFYTADIIKYWTDKGYDEKRIDTLMYFDLRSLVKEGKLAAVKEGRTHKYQRITAESNYEETLKSLKEGQKVLMGTIQ